ncbi:MAG: DUF167 domain-containing protein [Candidatus Krumholzibacteria bacterium]|nr:DUF167 domain-containing protein [Candidatus Krumholzibacteria bacterium]
MRIQPAAPRNELLGWNAAGELRIKVAAPPRAGEANEELVRFLAKRLSVPRREIELVSGGKSRTKTLSAPASLAKALGELPEI